MNISLWKMPRCIDTDAKTSDFFKHTQFTSHLRSATISPNNIGKVVHVHNGIKYIPLKISDNMVGYKFGMFALTKKRVFHKKKKAKK